MAKGQERERETEMEVTRGRKSGIIPTREGQITVTVPRTFFWDHANRGCVEYSGSQLDFVLSENKLRVTVSLHPDDIADLMSDAEYYGSKRGADRQYTPEICRSATLTVRALVKQGVERRHANWIVR